MSHLFVRGGIESDSEVQIQVGGTYAVDPDAFPESAQYVALGHLHRPQVVAEAPVPTRYAGSPLAYSFSEVGYSKSVVVLDVQPGRPADIREVFLASGKPLVRWTAKKVCRRWCSGWRKAGMPTPGLIWRSTSKIR